MLSKILLSKRDFEPMYVDYVGIDIIAYDNRCRKRLGISVKARTRVEGIEKGNIRVNSKQIPLINRVCEQLLPHINKS